MLRALSPGSVAAVTVPRLPALVLLAAVFLLA